MRTGRYCLNALLLFMMAASFFHVTSGWASSLWDQPSRNLKYQASTSSAGFPNPCMCGYNASGTLLCNSSFQICPANTYPLAQNFVPQCPAISVFYPNDPNAWICKPLADETASTYQTCDNTCKSGYYLSSTAIGASQCGGQSYTATYTCTYGSPPQPTGTISASPTSVTVPYGQSSGTTVVSYTSANANQICVWVSNNAAAATLWTCNGASASNLVWSKVPAGGNSKFLLTTSNSTPSPVLHTATVNGVAGAQPTMYASPPSLVVPYGAMSASTTVYWSAPGYSSVDWCGSTNGAPWQFAALTTAASGSAGVPVPPGTTYAYRIYNHGNAGQCGAAGMLASAAVTATQGAQPTFAVSPSHVIVPTGATSGTFTMSWNAPGYPSLDVVGQTNGGAWGAPFNIPASGNTGSNITVGTTYSYRFYPHGDTAHLLGTLSVTASY